MKTRALIASLAAGMFIPLVASAQPVDQFYCNFNGQEMRYHRSENPTDTMAQINLESEGVCAAGVAYLDNNKLQLHLFIHECSGGILASSPTSKFGYPSFMYLIHERPEAKKKFILGCEVERYYSEGEGHEHN